MTDLPSVSQFRCGGASALRVTQLCDSGICCAAHAYRAYPGRLGGLAPGEASGADKASSTRERDVCAVALSLLALIVRRFRGASPLGEVIERSSKERKAHAARGRRAGKA